MYVLRESAKQLFFSGPTALRCTITVLSENTFYPCEFQQDLSFMVLLLDIFLPFICLLLLSLKIKRNG